MGTLVVYPNHTTAVEGYVGRELSDSSTESWSSIRTGSGNTAQTTPNNLSIFLEGCSNQSDGYKYLRRGIFLFDTSALTSAATVTAATFGAWVNGKYSGFSGGSGVPGNASVNLYGTSPSSNTTLTASDYGTFDSTALSNSGYPFNSFASETAFSITLNSTGLSSISKTGVTKLGTRDSYYDADGNTLPWYDSQYIIVNVYPNFGVPEYSPKLTITFTGDPTVTTQAVSSVTATSLVGNGNITNIGGASPTRRGFCYMVGTSGDPTTANSVAYDDGTFSTGAYTKSITGLSELTNYRVRAYAVNSVGTAYGSTVQATTPSATSVKTFDGVARASVKTFNGVVSASIKTFNGIQ